MFHDRQQMIQAVRVHDFALIDLAMYLDSHPTCQKGLAHFRKHKMEREEAVAAYVAKYGPLTIFDAATCGADQWAWVNNPWPWELEGC